MNDIDVTYIRLTLVQMVGAMAVFGGIMAVNAVNVYKLELLSQKVDSLPPKYLIDAVNENRKDINNLKNTIEDMRKQK